MKYEFKNIYIIIFAGIFYLSVFLTDWVADSNFQNESLFKSSIAVSCASLIFLNVNYVSKEEKEDKDKLKRQNGIANKFWLVLFLCSTIGALAAI